MKKKLLVVLAAVALLTASTVGIGKAYAYFTTNAQASGRQTVSLGDQTTITEDFKPGSWTKTVRITNNSTSSQAVFVRARAFAGAEYPLTIAGTNWTQDGDWYVYGTPGTPIEGIPVEPGGVTSDLSVQIGGKPTDRTVDPREFNVVIVYETTPAVQNGYANGAVQYEPYSSAVWDRTTEEGGQNS